MPLQVYKIHVKGASIAKKKKKKNVTAYVWIFVFQSPDYFI